MTGIFSAILKGFLDVVKFVDAVKGLAEGAVKASIEIYNRISAELLPTPIKSHYTFNLRDVSKVFQGVLMIKSSKCQSPDLFKKLWVHESMRVFYDRLINEEDQLWFEELMCELLGRFFSSPTDHEAMFGDRDHPLLFGDFLKPGLEMADKTYEYCSDMGRVKTLLEDYLDEYNMTHASQMNLVFFVDAMSHCTRIARVLRQPRGNLMLIGVGGSGKQSLTRLAGSMSEMDCKMIELVRGYGLNELREDIKTFMIEAGVGGKHTVWLFTDTQIVNDSFLEDINNILNAGEVPNLFPSDELDKVIGDMRPIVKKMGLPETKDMCWMQFVLRVRHYLHIVLCMSPVGDGLRLNCRQFPSLINCTTIDWFMAWPMSALVSVAERFLAKDHLELHDEAIRPGIVQMCGTVHTSVASMATRFFNELRRQTYTTPKSYLDLISVYLTMLGEKREKVSTDQHRMDVGCQKLTETEAIVSDLQADLEKLKPVLKEKSEAAEALLKQVAIDQADAAVVKERVGHDEAEVAAQAAEVRAVQADAQKDLDVAMPALSAAVKALDSLSKSDITEVKSFTKPPPAVQTVMEAVCILLEHKPDWDTSKKLLGDSNFMQNLKEYDKDNIPEKSLKKVSKAATSLCMWVHAMDVYSKVAKEVGPKKAKLEEMNKLLSAANGKLAVKQAELKAVIDKVEALQKQCDETVSEKRALADQAQLTKDRLVRADKLTSGLAAEGVRWKATLENLTHQMLDLVGDTFIAGAFISYVGPFTDKYRLILFDQWVPQMRELGIPLSQKCTLNDVMGDPVQTRDWQLKGLGTDGVSVENAIMVTRGSRWPLMIDPQGQGNNWIKNMYEDDGIDVTSMTDPNLLRSLENCIRVGRALLVEDIHETLDPALEPILQKAVFKNGGRLLIHLGDSDVDYDENFKFFMTSKMPNPHYLPEVYIKVTMINFTVTMSGLEDQLLVDTVKAERPDVAERQVQLMLSMAADKKKLQEIQDNILKMLSESTGNILDDSVLIDTLADSKVTSEIIKDRVQESEKTNKEIVATQESYRIVATRAALLYFVVADMGNVDPMYQYSLEYYAALFNKCLRAAPAAPKLDDRLQSLIEYTTGVMYANICRGLFEKDKILYASLIASSILRHRKEILQVTWDLLLRGAGVVDREEQPPCPDKEKLPEFVWDMLYAAELRVEWPAEAGGGGEGGEDGEETNELAEGRKPFVGLMQHIVDNWTEWDEWAASDDPMHSPKPGGWSDKLDEFESILVIRAFREDLVLQSLTEYVGLKMGPEFAEAPAAQMQDVYDDMTNCVPCVFILSSGSDPTNMLLRFAKSKGYGERLGFVSLGQGQGPTAAAMIEAGCKSGDWVLLQNCMLAKSWMPHLETICFGLRKNAEENHEAFRLFLTSSPVTYFPVTILQNGVKMTNEPPRGFRAGILKDFGTFAKSTEWETCKMHTEWKKLCFGMVFFSVMVQERRKFGPLGWNIRYGFNETDLETSVACLRRFLTEQPEVPWEALSYVTGQINFGGRVTDDWDRRCLMSCLNVVMRREILDDNFRFSASGMYFAPPDGDRDSFIDYVKSLPQVDKPEIFGMHANANTIYNRDCTRVLMTDILHLQPRAGGGGDGVSSDDAVTAITEGIEEEIPADLDEEDAGETTFVIQPNGLLNSLAIVLQQESIKFNRLLGAMRETCNELKRAIKGFIVMSSSLDNMYTCFMNNQLPKNWTKVSFATLKTLGSWRKDLLSRIIFFREWLHNGQPATFPLPAFFFPQGFMTGTLQTFARKYMVPVNTLVFKFFVLDEAAEEITEGPDDGVICHGMFLEGARFCQDEHRIKESEWGVIYTPLPLIHFVPEANYKPKPTSYMCPVYKTAERKGVLSTTGMSTNFVVAIELPTMDDPDKWTLAGMAALLNLTD
jgi:dynein heavy chain